MNKRPELNRYITTSSGFKYSCLNSVNKQNTSKGELAVFKIAKEYITPLGNQSIKDFKLLENHYRERKDYHSPNSSKSKCKFMKLPKTYQSVYESVSICSHFLVFPQDIRKELKKQFINNSFFSPKKSLPLSPHRHSKLFWTWFSLSGSKKGAISKNN